MRAAEVALTAAQRAILESLSRSRTRGQRIVERATMIVMAAEGLADAEQARRLGVNEQRPRRWRGRWRAAARQVDAFDFHRRGGRGTQRDGCSVSVGEVSG